jgi:hypothetical protein
MQKLTLGKLSLLLVILVAFVLPLSAADRQIFLSSEGNQANLRNNTDMGFDVQYKVGELKINEIQTKAGLFDEISIDGWGFTSNVGEPKLPVMRKIIAVPIGADVRYTINSQIERQIPSADNQLRHRIIPAQESISKSADPSTIPFIVKEETYTQKGFGTSDYIKIEEIGYMRGVRVFAIEYHPVRYNPVDSSISVMQDITVRIDFDHPDLVATADMLAKTGSYEFDRLYNSTIFNWQQDERATLLRYPTKMLILCPPNYVTTLQPFVDWKKQQGFNVVVTTVGTGGTVTNTTAAINTYMAGVWSGATLENPAPSFLIIVGDTSTTGDNIIANTGTAGTHVTDLTYTRLNGTDMLPEMYYGRFSVSSATELTNVINKTVTFEKTAMPDLSYLGNVVMIAGADASYAPTYGNGQINYGTTYYFNATNGLTSNTYLYPASESSSAAILANANAGRGYMNYTAHGSETGWYSPSFSVTDANAMTNTNKYGVMVGNCCVTSKFDYTGGPCFGEALIRKANAAAVAYIGCTNNSYWDEDYWWGIGYKTPIQAAAHPYSATTLGAYDAMFHTHGEANTNWAPSVGETNYMGLLAVEQSTSPRKPYYWEIYSIMGDPSLMTYLGVPTTNTATYPSQILIGATSINVTAAPYSRVALTMGSVTYGTAIVPAGGSLTLTITPFSTVGTAKLVITAQNKITIQADVSIIPNSGPYVSVSATVYADSNNNVAEYNEAGRYNVTFQNVGSVAATSVVATLTCATAGITITDNTETIASLAAGASTTITNAYAFSMANNIVNGTSAAFTITMVSGANTWTYNFTLTINAPVLAFGSITISDPSPGNANGRLDPGETVTITMPLNNTGAAASPSGSATLTCVTTGITVNTGTANFTAIAASGSANLTYSVTASSSMTIGTVAALVFNATAGTYTATKTENVAVGLIKEDFSTGNFNAYPWVMGTTPWTIDSSTYYSAGYAAKSGTILASGSTTMQTTRVLSTAGTLTFYYKVSSESGYDYLKFYIDGTVQNSWSGTVDWTQASFALATGSHILMWEYMKDGSVDTGSDCAWVDDIVFPASTAPSVYNPPQNLAATSGNGFVTLTWSAPASGTPTGYKIYKNGSSLTTVTGLTYTDNAVANGTTYSYYLIATYTGGDSDPTATVSATPSTTTFVIVGTGTTSNTTTTACPINEYYKSLHGQSVYLASELTAQGITGTRTITQIGFNVTGLPTNAMPSFVVRMGLTTATNVATMISTGLTTVYTATSYQPLTTGWNMITLTTPFVWNGTSNIVVDTAFGLMSAYTQSGTTTYTSVTSGYIYIRSDTVDETSVYTGGTTSTYRPNVKIGFAPTSTGPLMTVNPLTLTYGNVAVGGNSIQQFTIQNTGDQTLTGTITTIAGYTVAEVARTNEVAKTVLRAAAGNERNVLSFSVNTGATKTYNLTFAPTAVGSYNGNIAIASNAATNPTRNIAVTGAGYIPPTISLSPNSISLTRYTNQTGTANFTISNTGSQNLTYTISESPAVAWYSASPASGSVAGSENQLITGSFTSAGLTPGTYNTTLNVASNDAAHPTMPVTVQFIVQNTAPTINAPTAFAFDMYSTLPVNFTPYVGDVDNQALTLGYSGNTHILVNVVGLNVTFSAQTGWYGTENITFSIYDGYVYAYDTVAVTVNFVNTAPTIDIPATCAFDMYSTLPMNLTSYVNDIDGQTLSLGYTGNTHIMVNVVGMNVTFSAQAGWYGTENITFSVYDGIAYAFDTTAVTVNFVNTAPTIDIPATIAFDENTISQNDFSSYLGDIDNQTLILGYSGNANIQVQIVGHNVQFSAQQDWVGAEDITFSVYDGYVYSYDTVNVVVNLVYLPEPPVTEIVTNGEGTSVGWEPVPNAQYYKIYRAFEPYGTYEYIGTTTSTNFDDWGLNPAAFYKIVAVTDTNTK